MADQNPNLQVSSAAMNQILERPKWIFDPVPEWVHIEDIDREKVKEFAKLQLELKIKELQIEQEKLQALRELVR